MKARLARALLPENRKFIIGILLGVAGSLCFGAKAIFVKMAYQHGITALPLLALRMIFSIPFFVVSLLLLGPHEKPIRFTDIWPAIVFGLLGYYLSSLLDFMGLSYVSVGLERLTLFLYPSFIIILSSIFLSKPVKKSDIKSLTLCYGGITLAFFSEITLTSTPYQTIIGTLLVAASALFHAIYLMGNGVYAKRLGNIRFTAYAMLSASVGVLSHYVIASPIGELMHYSPHVYMLVLMIAVFSTVLASFMVTTSISYIGAGLMGIIGTIGPVFTLVLGAIFLNEPLTFMQVIGMMLVIMGVLSVKKE